MHTKSVIFIVCALVVIALSPIAFSQQPVQSEEKVAREQPSQSPAVIEAKPESEASKISMVAPASVAAIYLQGLNMYVNPKVKFKLTTNDNIYADKIEYRVDSGEVKVFSEPFSVEQEGPHAITYWGVDKIGNKEDPKSYKFIVDATAPTIIVTSNQPLMRQGDKIFVSKDFRFKVDVRDDISGIKSVEYSLNGKDYVPYREPFGIPTEGQINLKIRATDNVQNVQEAFILKLVDQSGNPVELKESAIAMQTDNIAPKVEIKCNQQFIERSGVKIVSNTAKYTIEATDDASGVATIYMRVDGKGDFIPYTGELMFNTNGEHSLEARAVDKAGNLSPVTILQVYVDTIPPVSSIETLTE
ncbi:MAG: hypothetical protein N2316_08040 [Spirochaetes bacterium]|nr:hypothetical protein [Spirochaetota bacterium]